MSRLLVKDGRLVSCGGRVLTIAEGQPCHVCGPVIPTGACCLGGGSCSVLTAEECANAGGVYQGDGTGCDPNPCPMPPLCCTGGEVCAVSDGATQVVATLSVNLQVIKQRYCFGEPTPRNFTFNHSDTIQAVAPVFNQCTIFLTGASAQSPLYTQQQGGVNCQLSHRFGYGFVFNATTGQGEVNIEGAGLFADPPDAPFSGCYGGSDTVDHTYFNPQAQTTTTWSGSWTVTIAGLDPCAVLRPGTVRQIASRRAQRTSNNAGAGCGSCGGGFGTGVVI